MIAGKSVAHMQRMQSLFLPSVTIVSLMCILAKGVIYYVSPTLSSCPGSSSCPPGQHCYTIDYLVEHSSELFSPDHVNVTLIFMCGVHNNTKDLTVQHLRSFVMKEAPDSSEGAVIDHLSVSQIGKPYCAAIYFLNVSIVNITNLTMRCPSINLVESRITVKSSNLYGYPGTEKILSSISITGKGSQVILDNCTFKENCFIKANLSDGVIISNSTFQSYRHQSKSIIVAYSSPVTLSGSVNFTDSVTGIHLPIHSSGTAVFLYSYPKLKSDSALNITTGAKVYFVNLTCNYYGGAVYVENGEINVGNESTVVFMHNSAFRGGALFIVNTIVHVDTDDIYFYDNSASLGGAMYFIYGTMYINSNRSISFTSNTAQVQGGAIYIEYGVHSSIYVANFAKLFLFNNSALLGGALYVVPSSFTITVGNLSRVWFINNTAFDIGGGVYSEMQIGAPCMFMITDYSAQVSFIGNYANSSIGHHIYGTSVRADKCDKNHVEWTNKQAKPYCWPKYQVSHDHVNISLSPGLDKILSPVSSTPQRVCLCDSDGKPQCANISLIFSNISIYRGETFTLSAHVVGYDFGTTVGTVHAGFLDSKSLSQLGPSQYTQPVHNAETCTNLNYTVLTNSDTELLWLQTSVVPVSVYVNKAAENTTLSGYKERISFYIADYFSHDNGCLNEELLMTPIFINITLRPGCPPGLTLNSNRTECTCYSLLADSGFRCSIQNKAGFLEWCHTVWVQAIFSGSYSTGIIYNRFCPQHYCIFGNKSINIAVDPSKQCTSNRNGILCGACMENFSLAIGSSRCIKCPNNHNITLLLAFAAAGVFLVFFILALNLTVTQGFINGLIFYANIIWAYKMILFPSVIQENHWLAFLQVFVAWLNLDFGIETCFFVGLDAFWKTWLQFLFPLYIWAIAGVIIVVCRYSSHLTNLIGSRAVPLLATLFLLSYMKLLRTVIDATSIAVIAQYPQNTSYAVWYLDGNLRYCHHPHIYLFIVAIATLVLLWLPYTLLLLFIQPLRRMSHHLRPLKWIDKLAPVYDAYFSPLKDKHQYWFGSLLLVRGILLVLLTITSVAIPITNVFVLILFIVFLFFFMSVKYVYKRITVRLLESTTMLNLIVLSAGTLYKWESAIRRIKFLEVSIGIAFAQFCIIVILSLIKSCRSIRWRCRQKRDRDFIDENSDDSITHERIEDPELESLINCANPGDTKAASI